MMKLNKAWWYVVVLVALIILIMVVFNDKIGLSPKSSGKLKNTDKQNELNYFDGKLIKNPYSQEAKSLFSKFLVNENA